ncbi:MAG: hypothetical protein QM811_17925 [Pirellulales bacterium]
MSVASPTSKGPLALGLLIVAVGVGWLLSALGVAQNIDWIWTLGLGIVGVLTFVVGGGLDKFNVVVGPLFLLGSGLSILRQTGRLSFNIELPVLVIVSGVLLLATRLRSIPAPKWFQPLPAADR